MIIFLSIWIFLGIISEIIGCIYWEYNGHKTAIIVILLGFISLIAVILDIQDDINN